MSKRKPISKTLRFEVFKRDSFTCQYCGAKAPDAILHCDHIHPVAEGGKDELMNLVAACEACNLGKGARKLDDRSKVEVQRAQIEALEARREQLEMMLAWRDQAEREKIDVVQEIATRVAERGGMEPNENGVSTIRRWLKRNTVAEILSALDEAFDQLMRWDKNGAPDETAWHDAFHSVPKYAYRQRAAVERPYMGKLAYVQGIFRRRFKDDLGRYLDALEEIHLRGVPLDRMEIEAKRADDWPMFCGSMQALIESGNQGDGDGQD